MPNIIVLPAIARIQRGITCKEVEILRAVYVLYLSACTELAANVYVFRHNSLPCLEEQLTKFELFKMQFHHISAPNV